MHYIIFINKDSFIEILNHKIFLYPMIYPLKSLILESVDKLEANHHILNISPLDGIVHPNYYSNFQHIQQLLIYLQLDA